MASKPESQLGDLMNILVTGGAGYIGSHTSKLLKKTGHVPVVFDNLSNGWAEWVKFGPFAFGDIRDEEALFRTLTGFKIEAVIHFAAKAYVEESTRLPEVYFDNNVNGTISLLKAMKRAGTKTLVFSVHAPHTATLKHRLSAKTIPRSQPTPMACPS